VPVCQKILHSFSARLPQFCAQVSVINQFLTFRRALAHENPYPVCQKILHSFSARLPQFHAQLFVLHQFLAFSRAMVLGNPCQDFLQSWMSRLFVNF
jgi:hypothetical protein